ncbi:hypothetical protein [Roseivivax isoporae]|uniref:hypothetical protein n=1 Tax=Roseivivax isoporae TaxID=591206 RepID=UPI0012EC31EF|nr:hypothetical protein [Roseivivax isoporae]
MSSSEPNEAKIAAFRTYAREAILAASAINSGALVATLSAADVLLGKCGVGAAFIKWALGLAVATVAWAACYLANAAYTHRKPAWNRSEQFWTNSGIALFLLSVALFVVGSAFISAAFAI